MLPINEINAKLLAGAKALLAGDTHDADLHMIRSGQRGISPPLPYIEHTLIQESRKAKHQISVEYVEPAKTSGTLEVCYGYTASTDYQYALVADGGDLPAALVQFEALYDYALTDHFGLALADMGIGHTLLSASGVEEVNLSRGTVFDRRYLFELRYFWAHRRVMDASDISNIETIQVEKE